MDLVRVQARERGPPNVGVGAGSTAAGAGGPWKSPRENPLSQGQCQANPTSGHHPTVGRVVSAVGSYPAASI